MRVVSMESKEFNIYVYEPSNKETFNQAIKEAAKENPFKASNNSGADIRDLKCVGNIFIGFLANLRLNNLPHLAKINTTSERELPKDDDEALLEKAHFLYSTKTGFLFFQVNGKAFRNPNNIAEIFTERFNENITLNYQLTTDAQKRLVANQSTVYKLDVNVASPNTKLLGDSIVEKAIRFLAKNSTKVKLSISHDKRKGESLDLSVRDIWEKISQQPVVTKFIAYSSDLDEPIDLLIERKKFRKKIETTDGYVVSKSAYQKLEECREELTNK